MAGGGGRIVTRNTDILHPYGKQCWMVMPMESLNLSPKFVSIMTKLQKKREISENERKLKI